MEALTPDASPIWGGLWAGGEESGQREELPAEWSTYEIANTSRCLLNSDKIHTAQKLQFQSHSLNMSAECACNVV